MGMILRIASSRIVGQGDIVGRSGYFSLNLSANSVMRGRLDARRTLKSLVADLRPIKKKTTPLSLLLNLTDNDQLYYLFAPPHQNRTSDVCGSFKLLTPCTSTKQGNTYKPEYP